jgi:hypothetical protein
MKNEGSTTVGVGESVRWELRGESGGVEDGESVGELLGESGGVEEGDGVLGESGGVGDGDGVDELLGEDMLA